jgi:type IV pilus assembly protein PilA
MISSRRWRFENAQQWHAACYLDIAVFLRKGAAAMYTRMVILAAALASGAIAAEKETPSTIDIQKHTAAIGNAMAQAGNVEQLVAAFHQRNNTFPSNNAEAGVKPGGALASADVKSIDVTANGVVIATLTGNSGIDGGQIFFTPLLSDSPDDGVIRWRCTSPNYSTISDITGGSCEYSKLP